MADDKSDAPEGSAPEDRASQDRAPKDSAAEDGAAKDSAAEDGAAEGDAAEGDAAEGDAAEGGGDSSPEPGRDPETPMTDTQRTYLEPLAESQDEKIDDSMNQADAAAKIDQLQENAVSVY